MRRRKRSKLPLLFVVAGAVFAGAVLWQVLPRSAFNTDSAAELEARLGKEREERKRELQSVLEHLRTENQTLRGEIEKLRERSIE